MRGSNLLSAFLLPVLLFIFFLPVFHTFSGGKPIRAFLPPHVISGPDIEVKNWSGKSGHFLAEMIIRYGFGFGAFFIPLIFGSIGLYLLSFPKIKPLSLVLKFTFATIILSLLLGFIFGKSNVYLGSGPGGAQGYMVARWMNAFMGKIGTGVVVAVLTVSYLIFALKVKPESFGIKDTCIFKIQKRSQRPTR